MNQPSSDRPELEALLAEHPALSFLAELPEVKPRHIEPLHEAEQLLVLSEVMAAYARGVLLYWQPLLPKVLAQETRVPISDLNHTASLIQATGAALAGQADDECKTALERMQRVLATLRKYTPESTGPLHLKAERYEVPAPRGNVLSFPGARVPTRTSPGRTAPGKALPQGPPRWTKHSGLLSMLVFSLLIAGVGHGVQVWRAAPSTNELNLEDYRDAIPEIMERELLANGMLMVTVRNEWQKEDIGDRTDDVLNLLAVTAVEGWTRVTVQNEAGSALARLDQRGMLHFVRK